MGNNKNEVEKFYDDYVSNQKLYSFNERHYFLYHKMITYGLNPNSSVLELGCGIGIITSLINKKVKYGKIVTCDISEKSIEVSKKNNISDNIEFFVSDILDFKYDNFIFDYITFFDVLEHIPEENHEQIFKNIANNMSNSSKLLINIPTAEGINYFRKNKPEILQVIDQPLKMYKLLHHLSLAGLRLENFELLSLWAERDYQFMVIVKEQEYDNKPVYKKRKTIVERIVNKIMKE